MLGTSFLNPGGLRFDVPKLEKKLQRLGFKVFEGCGDVRFGV